jgi:hypothetical protein
MQKMLQSITDVCLILYFSWTLGHRIIFLLSSSMIIVMFVADLLPFHVIYRSTLMHAQRHTGF